MVQQTKPAALMVNQQKVTDLKSLLERSKASIKAVLPSHMTPERLVKIAVVAASRNPALLNCKPISILSALMDASQLGLEPFTGLNLSYIIPYKNGRTGESEAKFIPSYRGLVELARRSGQIKSIEADVVYEKDTIEIAKGLEPKLLHVPNYDGKDRGRAILVYAIVRFKDGGYQFEVMTRTEVEEIRAISKSPNNGPWADFWGEMAKKTVVKRCLKLCPSSTELATAIAHDNAVETGEELVDLEYVDQTNELLDAPAGPTGSASKSDSLVEQLSGVKTSDHHQV